MEWVINATPRSLYPREWPGTLCIGGWLGLRASLPLEMMQCQEHKPFADTKCFLKAEPILKMGSAADDLQQNGHVITQHG